MFEQFLNSLCAYPSTNIIYNPYQDDANPFNEVRLHNLRQYLRQMVEKRPFTLLVGEAPGYRGCRLSGIPFVSSKLLGEGVEQCGLFGASNGYQPIEEWRAFRREASATIMWQTLTQLPTVPLLWNALPFHPHHESIPQSNRTPSISELELGRPFLSMLLSLFNFTQVIAVGNRADVALNNWRIPHRKVRHPSHGGKRLFQTQLFQLLK